MKIDGYSNQESDYDHEHADKGVESGILVKNIAYNGVAG